MAKLDDFLSKKKETAPILDLSKATANTKEEFRKLFDKVPDYKMKPEKVRPEDIKIREKNFTFKTGKKDYKVMNEPFLFMDPIPVEMRNIKISDLASVPIDWRMLTTQRPKNKIDEDYYSRVIELAKLELKTTARDKRAFELDPQIRKSKNKAGVVEQRNVSCVDCGEDFCTGKICNQFSYDAFARVPELPASSSKKPTESSKDEKIKTKSKRKGRSRSKSKRRGGNTSKSPKKNRSKSAKKNKSKSPKDRLKSPKKDRSKSPKKDRLKSPKKDRSKSPRKDKSPKKDVMKIPKKKTTKK